MTSKIFIVVGFMPSAWADGEVGTWNDSAWTTCESAEKRAIELQKTMNEEAEANEIEESLREYAEVHGMELKN